MKHLLLFMLIVRATFAAQYYVDYDGGNNASAGTAVGTAWKHCPGDTNATGTAASTTLAAGDTVNFKGGVRYLGKIVISQSGTSGSPITFEGSPAGFGTGRAIIDGSAAFTNTWTQATTTNEVGGNANFANIWYANAMPGQTNHWNTVIVSNQFLPFAQDFTPSQPIYYDDVHNGWTNITTSGNVTTNFIKDTAYLTQPDGYWHDCWVAIFVSGNAVVYYPITNYFSSTNTIRFAVSPSISFYGTTKYSLINNMRSIDYAGEYAVVTNRMFMWPLGNVNPNTQSIRVAGTGNAFIIGSRQFITIQNFESQGFWGAPNQSYSASFVTQTGSTPYYEGIKLLNNDLHFFRDMSQGPVINLQYNTNATIWGNTISQCIRSRGMIVQGWTTTVSSNIVDRVGGTGIYCSGVGSSAINSNYVFGIRGVHGNGISIYQGSTNTEIGYNIVAQCGQPITFEYSGNLTFHHNWLDTDYGTINQWAHGGGYIYWLNNTIVGNDTNSSSDFQVLWYEAGDTFRIQNNVIDQEPPQNSDVPANTTYSHNLFLTTNTLTLPPNCIIRTNKTLNFTAYKTNLRPLSTYQGRGLGTNVSSFGVTKDLDGNTLTSTPDIGAWQFVASSIYQGFSFGSGVKLIGPGRIGQ